MALTNDQITAQNFKDFYTQILPYLAPPDLSSYVQKSQTAGLLKNDGTVDTSSYAELSNVPIYSAGTGIDFDTVVVSGRTNITINNTLSSARSGIVDYVFNTRAIITMAMATNEAFKPYETFVLTSPDDESQPAKVLRFPNNKDFNLYELDGTTTKSVIFNAGTTIIVMLDSTATKALVLAVLDIPNYVKKSSTTGLLKNDGTVDTNTYSTVVSSKTRYTITSSNWSSSANADGYYTLTTTLNPAIGSSPDVYVAGSTDSTQATDTEKGQFAYVKRCKVNGSTLTLYASSKPSSTFYIWVEGVNGTGSGDIVGNVIQPNGENSGGGSVITEVTQAIFKSDFSVESGGTSYMCNVYLSNDKETAIKQAKLVILLINKWSTDIEWFSKINICTPIIIPPNMFASAGDPTHEQLQQWGLTDGNTRFIGANFQYNPTQYAGHQMICQMRITDTEYNSLTSNQHYSCRFQLFS